MIYKEMLRHVSYLFRLFESLRSFNSCVLDYLSPIVLLHLQK